jgi:DNA-binding NtrC family response regulator
MAETILFVDDDANFLASLRRSLRGLDIETEPDPALALDKVCARGRYAVVVADMRMPGVDGIRLLATAARKSPETVRIMLTGHPDMSTAIDAVNKGQVYRFLTKPCSPAALKETLDAALIQHRLRVEAPEAGPRGGPGEEGGEALGLGRLVGQSRKMRDIFALTRQLAAVDTTVLITGESGTGKELIAEALHALGPRAQKPLVRVNCSALAPTLLESELFGHVRGAFTGAVKDSVGRFQAAQGGTLFLDEIGDIPQSVQIRLLRFLEQKEYERVGDHATIRADVRVVAATNVNLLHKVREGLFREDLYYRLRVVEIALPPLRERAEDIPLLVEHFVRHFGGKFGKAISGVSGDMLALFLRYPWPGNVRELKHALEHAAVLCPEGTIASAHLPPELAEFARSRGFDPLHPAAGGPGRGDLLEALNRTDWNKAKTARMLGVSRSTLYRKLLEYNITRFPG